MEDKRIVAVVIEGKFKNHLQLEQYIKKEKKFTANLSRNLEGNKGGTFLLYPDESFMDITYWDTPRNARETIENRLLIELSGIYNKSFIEKFTLKYYRVKWESMH